MSEKKGMNGWLNGWMDGREEEREGEERSRLERTRNSGKEDKAA